MPAYQVLLSRAAEKDLDKLTSEIVSRLRPRVLALAENPRPEQAERLSGPLAAFHRIRVGDYRVIYEVRDGTREVVIVRVRHRREVYR